MQTFELTRVRRVSLSPRQARAVTAKALVLGFEVFVVLLGTSVQLRGDRMLRVVGAVALFNAFSSGRLGRLRVSPNLLAFVIWMLATYAWSYRPIAAWSATVLWLCGIAVALHFLCSLPTDRPLALDLALLGAVVANLAYQLAFSVQATTFLQGGTQWRGAMAHKQQLGLLAALALAHLCSRFQGQRLPGVIRGAGACISLLLLVKSESALAMVGLVALACFYLARIVLVKVGMTRLRYLVYLVVSGLVLVAIESGTVGSVLRDITGKDTTLTGRTGIWSEVLRRATDRPWGGFGINAMWRGLGNGGYSGPPDPITQAIRASVGFDVNSSHSTYLETLLFSGWIGLGLLLAVVAGWLRQVGSIGFRPRSGAATMGLWMTLLLVCGIGESYLYTPQGVFILVTASCLTLSAARAGHAEVN